MKTASAVLAFAAALWACGCAPRAYTGRKLPADKVCLLEGGPNRVVSAVDGKHIASRCLFATGDEGVEALPGRHAVTYASTGSEEPFSLSFLCQPGHRYRLKAGELNAGLYGSRKVFMVEDAGTMEIVAAQK
ncbi:MAG: hypothetical protein HY922_07200 [Elusimicrobia bacterium]|nr:hypothetical protein [Elusimicrobiota bacterium]